MSRIVKRGFACSHRVYVVLDGSDALRGAVKKFFSDAVIQRCLVHKEWNIKDKLSKRHWGELARSFTRLRSVQGLAAAEGGLAAAEGVLKDLKSFFEPINAEAFKSLQKAGETCWRCIA